jgi:hypothetical protein
MRVLICGGRDYEDMYSFENHLEKIFESRGITNPIIIQGGAGGADTLAKSYANMYYLRCLEFPANWPLYKKRAGPIRNQQMLDEGKPHLVIAFPTKNSRGTYDMINRSQKAGVETLVVKIEDEIQ